MLDVDDLLRVWEAKRETLLAIGEYNLKMAEVRTELWRSVQNREIAAALLFFRRNLQLAHNEHIRYTKQLRRVYRTLNRDKSKHQRSANALAMYPSGTTLSYQSIRDMWTAFVYLGTRSTLIKPNDKIRSAVHSGLLNPAEYYSPSRDQSPTSPPPPHLRRGTELISWLRHWGLVPLGGTAADSFFMDAAEELIASGRTTADTLAGKAAEIRDRINEVNVEFFKQNLEIPKALGTNAAAS